MNTITDASVLSPVVVPLIPVLASADVDEVTLGRQTFNDSDKDNYFEG